MYLQRHFKPRDDWKDGVPALDHVEVLHTGWTPNQNFSTRLVEAGVREGWITLSPGQLVLHTTPEALVYTLIRTPGRYCCHCRGKLPDDATGEMARAHVRAEHGDTPSPDKAWPAGYCMLNHYECVLNAEQQERWGLTRNADGHLFRGGRRWKGERTVEVEGSA